MESPEIRCRNDKIMRHRANGKPRKAIATVFRMSVDAVNKVIERRLSESNGVNGQIERYGQKRLSPDLYDNWITIPDADYRHFEEVGGCYVLYSQGKPFYVGQSCNVSKRMTGHRITRSYDGSYYTPWGEKKDLWVKVKYHRRFGRWLECEARLIKKIKTKYNRRGYFFSH